VGVFLSVVTPLYDEVENVAPLLAEVRAALVSTGWTYEVLCVDDGSRDGTAAAVQEAAAQDPQVRLLRLTANRGQSAAMHAGICAARGDVIVTLDGDLQNDPADIPRLVAELGQADLVCGWRVNRRDPWRKRWASRIGNWVRRLVLRDGVHDTGCSLKAMKRDVRRTLIPFRAMHRFIPALARAAGHRVIEVPVNHRPRQHGRSKYGVARRACEGLRDLCGMRWWLKRSVFYEIENPSSDESPGA
jgi:dolichol-phosphate mannosyltransferase